MPPIVIVLSESVRASPRENPTRDELHRQLSALRSQGHRIALVGGDESFGCDALPSRGETLARLPDGLEAAWCELWGKLPGFFTANLELVRAARPLLEIDYTQAQELCRLGAGIPPADLDRAEKLGLSLKVRSFWPHPHPGTWIRPQSHSAAEVSAVVCQTGIDLVSIDCETMWQQAGFLARAFGVFANHGASIDMVATSQTNLTVSLDVKEKLSQRALSSLLAELPGEVRLIPDCSAVTLIGRRIRTMIPRLGPALEIFDEQQIHLMTQASSDVSLSLVVDSEQAPRLVKELHQLLFGQLEEPHRLGPAIGEGRQEPSAQATWWTRERERLLELARGRTPLYVYDEQTLLERLASLSSLQAIGRLFYAIKANNNTDLLRALWSRGVGLECVSVGEIEHVLPITGRPVPAHGILFTPNFAPLQEYEAAYALGATVTLDSLAPLQSRPDIFADREVFLRLDSGLGDGHHKHVRTGGNASKFGISAQELEPLLALLEAHRVTVTGLHCHQGSGIMNADNWVEVAELLKKTAEHCFPHARVLDLGGGLGVPERRGKDGLNLARVGQSLQKFKADNPRFELWLEPGRFLVAECGVLLATVTQVKQKAGKTFVGLDTGFNSLVRPALYGAYHEIVNLTRLHEEARTKADVVGPICETGDVLGRDRWLPVSKSGDTCLIGTAGAYGRVMSNNYNLREPAAELVLHGQSLATITGVGGQERQTEMKSPRDR